MSVQEQMSGPGIYPIPLRDPYANEHTQPFWDAALKGELVGCKCKKCGTFRIPPHPYCFNCQSRESEWTKLPGTGTIYSFIVVRHPLGPHLKEVVPYVSAVINVDGTQGAGARLLLNVVNVDVDKVKIGDKVKIIFDKLSDTYAAPRATPA
ncbi:MAG: OB-fold domain-containing protein [Caulobacterales bacterium]